MPDDDLIPFLLTIAHRAPTTLYARDVVVALRGHHACRSVLNPNLTPLTDQTIIDALRFVKRSIRRGARLVRNHVAQLSLNLNPQR